MRKTGKRKYGLQPIKGYGVPDDIVLPPFRPVTNITGGNLSEAIVLQFILFRGATA